MIDLLLTTSDFDPSGLVGPQPQNAPRLLARSKKSTYGLIGGNGCNCKIGTKWEFHFSAGRKPVLQATIVSRGF